MALTLKLNQDYVNNTLIPNYAAVALQTELGGNTSYLYKFSYAGSTSSYSFGLFQYDIAKQGAGSDAQNFLTSIGFSATQISQLSQHGGLSSTVQSALSNQLNTALQNPVNQAALDQLNISWSQGLVNQLQSALDVVYQKNPAVALQIYGSQELQLRLMDYANQYHLDSTGPMTNWLSGQAVAMASGSTLNLSSGQMLSGVQLDNFIMNTQQGTVNLNGNVTTRLNALNLVAPTMSSGSPSPIVDSNGIASPVTTGTSPINIPGQPATAPADPRVPYVEITGANQTGRLYDNGVLYTQDPQTGVEHWSVPTANGGVIDTTQHPNGQITSVQYNRDVTTGAWAPDTTPANIRQYLRQHIQDLSASGYSPQDQQIWQNGLQELDSAIANDPDAIIATGPDGVSVTTVNGNFTLAGNALTQTIQTGSITTRYNYGTGTLTQTVESTLNGQTVNVTYTYGADGQPVAHVNSINGKPPINQAAADAGLKNVLPSALAAGDTGVAGTNAGGTISANDADHPNGLQTLAQALSDTGAAITSTAPALIDALSLVQAVQNGQPLPVVASGLRVMNDLTSIRVPNNPGDPDGATKLQPTHAGLNGATHVAGGVLSLMRLDAALKRGDNMEALAAGAQTISYSASATEFAGGMSSTALPSINLRDYSGFQLSNSRNSLFASRLDANHTEASNDGEWNNERRFA